LDAFATAVKKVLSAKAAWERAVTGKKDIAYYDDALSEARKDERLAVAALDQHRKEHGC
jgi:hypothetical protein